MLDNQAQAEKHFAEKAKAYKPGTYFLTSDGQIFDDKVFAMERVRTKRGYSLKVFTVKNEAKPTKKKSSGGGKSSDQSSPQKDTSPKVAESKDDKKDEKETSKK